MVAYLTVCAFVHTPAHAIIFPMSSNATTRQAVGCTFWLALLTALLTLVYVGAAWHILQRQPDVAALVRLPLPFEFIASVIWGFLSAFVTVSLVRRHPLALYYTKWLVIGLTAYNITRWIVFVRADYDRQRLPFLLIIAIIVILTALVLRPTENSGNGRKSED